METEATDDEVVVESARRRRVTEARSSARCEGRVLCAEENLLFILCRLSSSTFLFLAQLRLH